LGVFRFFLWIGRHLRNRIFAGLILIVPAALTYVVFRAIVGFLDDLIRPSTKSLAQWFPGSGWVDLVPPVGSVVLVLILLYFAGLIARNFVGRRIVRFIEGLVGRVPVLRAIYGTVREATSMFSSDAERRFSRVVLVTYPHPGAKSLGFVTGTFRSGDGKDYSMVYVPTTPTPMSGFLLFVTEDQMEDAGISVDAAMRMVITGGILSHPQEPGAVPDVVPQSAKDPRAPKAGERPAPSSS
jgi:uncharacterized membrane protein